MPDAVGRFLNKEGIQWALRRVLHEVRRSPCRGSRQQAKHAVIVTSEPASSVCAAHPSTVAEKRRWSVLRPTMPPGWKGGRLARRLHYGAGQIFLCLWYTA